MKSKSINILDIFQYYKNLEHQKKAVLYWWENTPLPVKERFVLLWRNESSLDITRLIETVIERELRENAREAIPLLLEKCDVYGVSNINHISYIIATVRFESCFKPVREVRANPRIQPQLYALQERYWHTGYYGRGYIQLTWRENYEKMSKRLGIDLVKEPDLLLEPEISATVVVVGMKEGLFTGRKLSDFDLSGNNYDFLRARAIVNALDNARMVADYALSVKRALERN